MTPVVVELLYRRFPRLDEGELAQALQGVFGEAEVQREGEVLLVSFPGHTVRVRGREVPISLLVREEELERCSVDYEDPLSQDWDWPEAEEALMGCEAALVVTDPHGPSLPPPVRVAFLMGVLRVLVSLTEPAAIHGCDAHTLVDPEGYEGHPDPLVGLVAVRRFRVDDENDGELLDTLGLGPFGLQDLEIRAPEGEGGRWARRLQGLAWTQLTDPGWHQHTEPGWRLIPSRSSVAPHRAVWRLIPQGPLHTHEVH